MASTTDMLADLESMNDTLASFVEHMGTVPNKIIPEPAHTLVGQPVSVSSRMPLTYSAEAVAAERLQRNLQKKVENTEGGGEVDTDDLEDLSNDVPIQQPTNTPSDTFAGDNFSNGSSQIDQLNKLSAEEFLSTYSNLVNTLSIEGFEWKNGDSEKELKKERDLKRRFLQENSLSVDEQNSVRQRIDEITQMLEKHGEVREKLEETTQLTPEKQQQAATLLAEIWKIKGVEVSPYWALVLIICAPLLNAVLIIFSSGKQLKPA